MEKEDWILQKLQEAYNNCKDSHQSALLIAAQNIIHEQAKRIEQMEGNIDGILWSPRNWGE